MFLIVFFSMAMVSVQGSSCEDVYPQLSCGLGYNNETSCEAAGCCWDYSGTAGAQCFAPKIYGYNYTETQKSAGQTVGTLHLIEPSGIFTDDFEDLTITITQETSSRTHIKITEPGSDRWEVPETLLPRPGGLYTGTDALLQVVVAGTSPLELVVSRAVNGVPTSDLVFILSKMLVFQDQYLQFVLGTPSSTVATYGFGESTRDTQHLEVGSSYTLWNTDYAAAGFDESLYGTHPFYVQVADDGTAAGAMFLNSNAMEVTIADSSTQGGSIGVQSTGGVLDLYIFAGPSPADVVKQYLEVVGKPAMMPYWSLGFHNCRWGYENVQYVADVVANYSAAEIPLETQWMDIDYMDAYLDFTLDPVNFPESQMSSFVNNLHANNQRFVPIIDPGIYVRDQQYDAFTEGLRQNVFVMDMTGVNPYLGQVWPGPTYFPDWFAENTTSWWTEQLSEFSSLVDYDGLWIDMNEVANFCNLDGTGQVCELNASDPCPDNECCLICSTPDPTNTYDFPPFIPNTAQGSMGGKTLSMNSYHAGGILEYNSHSLYGFMESIATRSALEAIRGKRPFLLSRSTYMGSGVYTAHWTGDNAATWDDLSASIITMNNMALFGIPMVGADICGFIDSTTEELCARWIEVGAFSPFSRNHNIIDAAPQELYRWESVAEASRTVLNLRYRMLPYLYTLMYRATANGDTVHNAMWMHFPEDQVTFFRDGQYMWSNGILFTPVLTQGATSVEGYFPAARWYSLLDDTYIDSSGGGLYKTLDTPLTATNVHARGGTVIPMQVAAMTTTEVKNSPFTLYVALDNTGTSSGSLFLDDGEQISLTTKTEINYVVSGGVLTSIVLESGYAISSRLEAVEIRGVLSDYEAGTRPKSCTAFLQISQTGAVVVPSSVVLTAYSDDFSGLKLTFNESTDVNIVSNFDVTWNCEGNVDKKSDNDDDKGWKSIPSYGQALIIVACVVVVCGVAAALYFAKSAKSTMQDPLVEGHGNRA